MIKPQITELLLISFTPSTVLNLRVRMRVRVRVRSIVRVRVRVWILVTVGLRFDRLYTKLY